MNREIGKGEIAEEALRQYFIERGYFVVRSLPFTYNQIDITDLDLWLYSKASAFSRERTNVDIKNKKNPRVFERIIWAKGLQTTLRLERAIVATTSTKDEAQKFGLANNIIMITGDELKKIIDGGVNSNRITEENFIISTQNVEKREDDYKRRYQMSKSRLLSNLNFDGCNEYLQEIKFFLEQSMIKVDNNINHLRLLYINIAFLLICIDFITKEFTSVDIKTRAEILQNGFNYGERGKERTEIITNAAIKLASSVIANQSIATALKREVDKQTKYRPVEILSDYFAKTTNMNSLFKNANLFEFHAYSQVVTKPSQLPIDLQSIIGLLTDFFRMDRKKILNL